MARASLVVAVLRSTPSTDGLQVIRTRGHARGSPPSAVGVEDALGLRAASHAVALRGLPDQTWEARRDSDGGGHTASRGSCPVLHGPHLISFPRREGLPISGRARSARQDRVSAYSMNAMVSVAREPTVQQCVISSVWDSVAWMGSSSSRLCRIRPASDGLSGDQSQQTSRRRKQPGPRPAPGPPGPPPLRHSPPPSAQQAQDVAALDDGGSEQRRLGGPQGLWSACSRSGAQSHELGSGACRVEADPGRQGCRRRGAGRLAKERRSRPTRLTARRRDRRAGHGFTVPDEYGGATGTAGPPQQREPAEPGGAPWRFGERDHRRWLIARLRERGAEERSAHAQRGRRWPRLTEVGVGVTAKKVQAMELDETGECYRLHATGPRAKMYITTRATARSWVSSRASARTGRRSGCSSRTPRSRRRRGRNGGGRRAHRLGLQPLDGGERVSELYTRERVHQLPIPRQPDRMMVSRCCSIASGRAAACSPRCPRGTDDDGHGRGLLRPPELRGAKVIKHKSRRETGHRAGAPQSRALSHLSLQQILTGSISPGPLHQSRIHRDENPAATGTGRRMDVPRSTGLRQPRQHARLGVVEGEDDLILMGVKDVTNRYHRALPWLAARRDPEHQHRR